MRTIIINKRQRWTPAGALLVALLCGTGTDVLAEHDYTVTVDEKLAHMTVRARFDRPVTRIAARSRDARRFLRDARDCTNGKSLPVRSRTLSLPREGIECLAYSVNLRAAAGADRFYAAVHPSNLVVSPSLWMWRPRLGGNDAIDVRFELPPDTGVFVPWPAVDDEGRHYRLRASPQSGSAVAVFGSVVKRTVRTAGAELTVVFLRSAEDYAVAPFLEWVQSTVENVAQAYGRYPNPDASVVLIPVATLPWSSERPVPFGRVVRDGGETIELLIDPQRDIEEFYNDWTPTHEFSHLMLPYLDRDQRWISEGFAQYYQNILLARAGRYSDEQAWQKIHAGLEQGRESAPGLSPNDAAGADERNTRMKVYWSGASIALMADVELRRRSAGRESLDTVLGELQRCCLPSDRAWSGIELFRQLDGFLDEPLFMDLYRRYADAGGFPDARPLLCRLGVRLHDGQVRLDNSAELAAIREAMTR